MDTLDYWGYSFIVKNTSSISPIVLCQWWDGLSDQKKKACRARRMLERALGNGYPDVSAVLGFTEEH
ncbi:MAG: hypothetical protein ACR2PH_03235 [Desulfobulbia bacterium]